MNVLCATQGVSDSGYSACRRREPSQHKQDDQRLGTRIGQPVAPNLLARAFAAEAPNQKWVADITAIPTQAGWLYLAAILDIYSHRVIGWAMDRQRDERLVVAALQMALLQRRSGPDLLHHSDRGSQYTSRSYRALLAQQGIAVSMSRLGNCYDNALLESLFGTLKAECVARHTFQTPTEAQTCLFEYLESLLQSPAAPFDAHLSLADRLRTIGQSMTILRLHITGATSHSSVQPIARAQVGSQSD